MCSGRNRELYLHPTIACSSSRHDALGRKMTYTHAGAYAPAGLKPPGGPNLTLLDPVPRSRDSLCLRVRAPFIISALTVVLIALRGRTSQDTPPPQPRASRAKPVETYDDER